MKWSLRTGTPIDNAGEQLIALPLALASHEGEPLKGQKSYNYDQSFRKTLQGCSTTSDCFELPSRMATIMCDHGGDVHDQFSSPWKSQDIWGLQQVPGRAIHSTTLC